MWRAIPMQWLCYEFATSVHSWEPEDGSLLQYLVTIPELLIQIFIYMSNILADNPNHTKHMTGIKNVKINYKILSVSVIFSTIANRVRKRR